MSDSHSLWLADAKMTHSAGVSLAQTLYRVPLTIWLSGTLGAGKTTFLQGFGEGLGIPERLTSPTYALEQRYRTRGFGELLHIDLYRLTPSQAVHFVNASDLHPGLRCIEWADRLLQLPRGDDIEIRISEEARSEGRKLSASFRDIPLPSQEQIDRWREEFFLSHAICRHCDAVAETAVRLGQALLQRGQLVRLDALRSAGAVHDLLRFVDFHRGTGHVEEEIHPQRARIWEEVKTRYPQMRHEAAIAQFLTDEGFSELAEIVRPHGLTLSNATRITTEQRLLYYADKRVKLDEVVSLDERLRDFTVRYSYAGQLRESDSWYSEARQLQDELFPDGPPF